MSVRGPDSFQRPFRIDEWLVEPGSNRLRKNGKTYQLEPRQLDLLLFLATNARRTVTKEEIFEEVWAETFVTDSALWKSISELRQILEEPGRPARIVTVPRRGYRLDASIRPVSEVSERSSRRTTRWLWVTVLAASLVPTGLLVRSFLRSDTLLFPAGERPTILLTRLDNRTGNPWLDDTLEVILEGRLNDSGRVRLVSRGRVEDSLSLMRRPVDALLTEELAHQVSVRDGQIDFVIAGQIVRLGSRHDLILRLFGGQSQEVLDTNEVRAASIDDLLAATDEQASWLLSRLGTERTGGLDRPERVTTRSLEALSLYTRGVPKYSDGARARQIQPLTEALLLFEEARLIDPEFASAHLMVAWSHLMLNRVDPVRAQEVEIVYRTPFYRAEDLVTRPAWEAMERAMATREHASLAESSFIQGCYYNWKGEFRRAAAAYRLVIDLAPEHYWAPNNLLMIGVALDEPDLLAAGALARSRGRPNRIDRQWLLNLLDAGDLVAAREVRDRTQVLLDTGQTVLPGPDGSMRDYRPIQEPLVWTFDVWSLWHQGEYSDAVASLVPLARRVADLPAEDVHLAYAYGLAGAQVMLGKLADARQTATIYGLGPEKENWRFCWVASPDVLVSVLHESAEPLGEVAPETWLLPPRPFARMLFDKGFRESYQEQSDFRFLDVTRELVAALQLEPHRRIESLRSWLHRRTVSFSPRETVLAVRWLISRDLVRIGRGAEAVEILEKLVAERDSTFLGGVVVWQKATLDLARAYQRAGRDQEAERLLVQLAEMLRFADPDHPIVSVIKQSAASKKQSSGGKLGASDTALPAFASCLAFGG